MENGKMLVRMAGVWLLLGMIGVSWVGAQTAPVDDTQTLVLWHCDTTVVDGDDTLVPDDNSNTGRPTFDLNLSETYGSLGDPTLTTGNGGKFGEALVFNEDYALVRDVWTAYDSVEISFWMNVDQLPSTSGAALSYLFRTGVWDLTITGGDELQWTARNSSGSAVGYLRYDISTMEDQWIYVVATFSNDLSMTLSVDGDAVSTTASEMWWLRPSDGIQVGYLTTKPADRGFKGMLDEIKISVPSLDQVQVDDWQTLTLLHMDSTVTDGDTFAPDDNSNTGRTANDLNITVGASGFGDPTLTTGGMGRFGEALQYHTDFSLLNDVWNAVDSVVIDFWVNFDELPSDTGEGVMYLLRTGVWDLAVTSSDELQWTVRNSSGSGVGYVRRDLSGLQGQWIHIIATFTSDLNLTVTVNRTTATATASEMWWLRSGDDIHVGAQNGKPAARGLRGRLDELKISIPSSAAEPAYVHPYEDEEFQVFGLWHMDQVVDKDGDDAVLDDDSNSSTPRDHDMLLVQSFISGLAPTLAANEQPEPFGADPDEFGSSMYFDGWPDLYLEADTVYNDMLGIDLDNVRYEAWYKVSQDAIDFTDEPSFSHEIITNSIVAKLTLDRYLDGGETDFWQFVARFRLNEASGNYLGEYVAYYRMYGDDSPLLDGWHHIAAEYEAGEVRLFIDGQLMDINADPPADAYIRNVVGQQVRIGTSWWGWLDEVRISRATPEVLSCGDWGYLDADINYDCNVDFGDMSVLAGDWLNEKFADPASGADDYPTLVAEGWPVLGNYNVPQATVTPTIDASITTGEWEDARRIEMVYPDLVTPPNIGHLRPGGVANASVPPDSPADCSLYWFVKWDSSNLYLLGVVYDDIITATNGKDEPQWCFNYLNNPAAVVYTDAFIWYLDADGVGSDDTAGGPVPSNTVIAYNNGGDHYVIEAQIPWSDLDLGNGYTPTVGDVHGFGFLAQDHDADGDREHFMWDMDVTNIDNIQNVTYWNTMTLVANMPCGEDGFDAGDIDASCEVDLADFAELNAGWMQCSNPQDTSCSDAR